MDTTYVFVGTKAQLVKMAPVVRSLREVGCEFAVVTTGQHQQTIDEMRMQFELPSIQTMVPRNKDVSTRIEAAFWFAKALRLALFSPRKIFREPGQMVLVHGDTLSTLVAAIAARRAGRCVGHVESGLRSESIWQPFPEEILRRIVFRLSDVLYCPSSWAATNVAVLKKNIVITHGNTMIDTVRFALEKIDSRQRARVSDYALVTSHRFENIFNRKRLKKLVELVELLASRQAVRFVLHTPTEHQLRKERLLARLSENPKIEMVPRMPHFEFLTELAGASCVLSDGGSIQEETSYLGVPCFLLRDYTERNEGLGSNAMLGGLSTLRLAEFLENLEAFRKPPALTGASPSLAIAKDVKARTAR